VEDDFFEESAVESPVFFLFFLDLVVELASD